MTTQTLTPHNDYPQLKRQLRADAKIRALAAGVDADDIGSIKVEIEFENPVWNGTYPPPVWANVDIDLDGGCVYRVTHDWEHDTLTADWE